ncbi:MAG TPA: hypothetical protein VF661_14760 [Actinomycetales bacterium]
MTVPAGPTPATPGSSGTPAPDDDRDRLLREVTRVADRLSSLGLPRLNRPADDGSPADRAHAAAQRLADLAADSAGRACRPVPRLAAHAGGDQLVVLAQDLLDEGDAGAVRAATDVLVALRRSL